MTAPMEEERASVPSSPPADHEEVGDSACWAHRVCPECGRLNQTEHPGACEACGAAFPARQARGARQIGDAQVLHLALSR
jgi:hypothetical protein